jgi:hypothetical protein
MSVVILFLTVYFDGYRYNLAISALGRYHHHLCLLSYVHLSVLTVDFIITVGRFVPLSIRVSDNI